MNSSINLGPAQSTFAATQLARPLHQERLQVVCSHKEAQKRLARRHSRSGPWT